MTHVCEREVLIQRFKPNLVHSQIFFVSQLRQCLLEGYQQCGRIIYVWVSTEWDIFLCIFKIQGKTLQSTISLSLGVSSGAILVFDVPSKGSNITLSEVLEEHKESITDMASECSGSQVTMACVCASSVCALSVVALSDPLLIQGGSQFSMNDRLPQ